MLNKLNYFNNPISHPKLNNNPIDCSLLVSSLEKNGLHCHAMEPSQEGTLGVGFRALINGSRWFIKTHLLNDAIKANFLKEIALFSVIYNGQVDFKTLHTIEGNQSRTWLIMEELVGTKDEEVSIHKILELIRNYSKTLSTYSYRETTVVKHDFSDLMQAAYLGLSILAKEKLISSSLQNELVYRFNTLKECMVSSSLQICHGDLGPKNIMSNDKGLVVIDWEDAFWGIEGYDYLYWLTFFSNRIYLSQDIFGKTPWDKETDISIMLLILVLKSNLSYLMNTLSGNMLTIEERISEILNLN